MTTHPDHVDACPPQHVAHRDGTDVPTALWRLDDARAGFTVALARRLLHCYTDPGDTVVGLTGAPALRLACASTARTHLAATHLTATGLDPTGLDPTGLDPTGLDPTGLHPAGLHHARLGPAVRRVSLVVLHWPAPPLPAALPGLFTTCRRLTTTGACTIAAVETADTGPGALPTVVSAARAAGLQHTGHILAVTGDGGGSQFVYHATAAQVAAARHRHRPVDLLVFTT